MNVVKQRLIDLGKGHEGSDGLISVSTADALALKIPITKGQSPTIVGKEILPFALRLSDDPDDMPTGAEPSPNQQSVSPGPHLSADPVAADPAPVKKK